MPSSEVKYNVQVRDGDRWSVYTDAPTKGRATQEAQKLLSTGQWDAAKVTEDRGQSKEILIWQEEGNRAQKVVSVTPVETSYLCREVEDFYKIQSRLTIGKLIRQHLDQQVITALELLTDKVHLIALMRNDKFYNQALQAIANLQVKGTEQKALVRLKFIEQMIDKILAKTDLAGEAAKFEKTLKAKGMAAAMAEIEKSVVADNRHYYILSALGTHLSSRADWESKLELLVDLAEKPSTPEALAIIDEAMAEILDGSEAVQELLGYQRNLAAALNTMVQLASGSYAVREGSNSTMERLSGVMKAHKLNATQTSLLERVGRSLAGINHLTKGDRHEEQDAFKLIIRNLLGKQLLNASGTISEAATKRAKIVLKDEKDDESSTKAIDAMIALLPTIAAKLGYLLDLVGTEFGKQNQERIVACLANVLASITSVEQLVDRRADAKMLMSAAAGIRDRLMKTDIPEVWRQRFAKKIYDLLMAYSTGTTPAPTPKSPPKPAPVTAPVPSAAPQVPAEAVKETKTDANLNRLTFKPGEFIFHEGEQGDEAYLILSGQVNIVKSAGEQEVLIAEVSDGAIIGEMALIDAEPRMASARAAQDTSVSVIPSKDMKTRFDRLEKFDPVMRRLMGMYVQRMRESRFIQTD